MHILASCVHMLEVALSSLHQRGKQTPIICPRGQGNEDSVAASNYKTA